MTTSIKNTTTIWTQSSKQIFPAINLVDKWAFIQEWWLIFIVNTYRHTHTDWMFTFRMSEKWFCTYDTYPRSTTSSNLVFVNMQSSHSHPSPLHALLLFLSPSTRSKNANFTFLLSTSWEKNHFARNYDKSQMDWRGKINREICCCQQKAPNVVELLQIEMLAVECKQNSQISCFIDTNNKK